MQKEFIQTVRDSRTLVIQLVFPLVQLFLFGYAISMNVDHIRMAVADQSLDAASRGMIDAMVSSSYFDEVMHVRSQKEVVQAIDEGQVRAGLVIPPNFAADVERGSAQVLILIDGSDFFTSQSAYNAASVIAEAYASDLMMYKVERAGLGSMITGVPLDARVRILYNPNLDNLWFIIPGMLAMLLQLQSIVLTAAAVVREREVGTLEQLLVTPIRPGELMLGKIVPNIIIALVNVLTILGLGVFWFKVPFQGDFGLFLWLSFLYVFSGLGLGLLISTVSQSQRQAGQLIALISMVGLVLGGFIFPRYTMPVGIRLVGNLFPLTYFIPITRGIITKGVGLGQLWEQVVPLFFYVLVIMTIAARTFKQELE